MKTKLSALKAAKAFLVALSVSGVVFAQADQPANQKPASQTPTQQTLPHKTNIAVINLKSSSGVATGEADLISDRLRGDLFNTGKVNVMERDQMQEILKEQGFQQSGACSNEACMVEMGQLLGVEQLVTGSLGKVGSMFLVNLRIIDVKTAKITKVVSKDIKGSIEDVVGELGPIAVELVGASQPAPAPEVVGKKTEEKPAEPEQPKPETVSEPAKTAVSETALDDRAEKNKNRAGIRLTFNLFGSGIKIKQHYKYSDTSGNSSSETYTIDDSNFTSVDHTPFFNPQLKFIIKAGPFIAIDLGPSWTYGNIVYKRDSPMLDTTRKWDDNINVFGLALGVNFVKRWYPVKFNVGLMIDFNYLNYMEEFTKTAYDYYYSYTSTVIDTFMFYNSFNVSAGFRVGAEIMIGKHFGISMDFVYRYSYFETIAETHDYGYGTEEMTYQIDMPPIAFGLGFNFYY
jgi:curli biogenesis system outer membrane secretion channel CsgG